VKRILETSNAHCRAMLEALEPEERARFVDAMTKIVNSIA
jgi:hypothetical protein